MAKQQLVWKDEYNIVKEIDDQHKHLFEIINSLIVAVGSVPNEETISEIINKIVEYKAMHFTTEEKYFYQFNFEGTSEHVDAHNSFNLKIKELKDKNKGNALVFAFELVDFLEDWLIGHLMSMDKKYKKCFNDNGLF